ncbi:hypothetical protein GGR56DRAFT_689536 [Xylariaceae sp. FL0804]|nr:hypothetical protein GGR56DRAFT_689536 [Xylariaceae sp. FL0804]
MDAIKNTIGENFGGKAEKLATHQFSLDDVPDLSGKVAVVTGGSEGIGFGATYTMLKHNIAKIYILSVDDEVVKGAKGAIAKDLGQEAANKTHWIQCDLADWARVKDVAEEIKKSTDRLDILINNAARGIMTYQVTDYGVDRHMAVNHMAHVILTSHLLPLMKQTAEKGNVVRISNQASNAHQAAPSDTRFESVDELNRDLGPNGQYGRSKLAGILYARYFARKVTHNGHPNVLMNATHPGFVSTKMSKEDIHEPYPLGGYAMSVAMEPFKKDQFQGAVTTMYVTTVTKESGQYICPPAVPEPGSELAQDDALADRLMELTRKVVMEKTKPQSADKGCPFDDLFSRSSTDPAPTETPQSPDNMSVKSNSTVMEAPPPPPKRVSERTCSVTINDSLQPQEVLLNLDLVGGGAIQPGSLMSITAVKPDSDRIQGSSRHPSYQRGTSASEERHGADGDAGRRYVFVAKDMSKELKAKYPTVEVYVAKQVGDAFNMKKGTQVLLAPVDHLSPAVEASHVELSFRDMYLSRADMWRLATAELVDKTVYKGQVMYFLGTIKATVSTVFVEGRKAQSAFFARNTRPIFRSESARYVLFIQMAREMWDFDADGSGEIMFHKVVNGFLPALFKKWALLQVKHLVSIVLFTRVEYDTGLNTDLANTTLHNDFYTGFRTSGACRPYKDFYRVVVSEMSSGEWTRILHQLKKEFNVFRRDISLHHEEAMSNAMEIPEDAAAKGASISKVKVRCCPAMYGNFLESINVASSLYAHDYIDRDLLRTGISIVVISPGSGVFEVEYESLRRTTEALVGNGIGIDLICIPNMPLHSVPLFRYRNPLFTGANQRSQPRSPRSRDSTPKQIAPLVGSYTTLSESMSPTKGTGSSSRSEPMSARPYVDEWAFALPQWLHVSYWTGRSDEALAFHGATLSAIAQTSQESDDFTIRCRLYELQMRSVLETNEIETTPLHADPAYPRPSGKPPTGKQKPKDALFEPVYGFHKFIPDKLTRPGETSIWKQLQAFDESRARLPPRRHPYTASSHPDIEVSPKKQSSGDTGLFGTSVGDKTPTALPQILSSSVTSSRKIEAEPLVPTATSRRSSTVSNTQPKSGPARAPKLMRQISLGQRGFGVAAPKVATAEVRIEHVNALQTQGSETNKAPPSSGTALSTPSRPVLRSGSSSLKTSASSRLSTTFEQTSPSLSAQLQDMGPSTPSQPIQIRGPPSTGGPVSALKAGPILASPMAKSVRHDDRDIRYSNVLRQEDQKRLYNSKLRAGGVPELPTTLSPTTAMAPWLVVLNPSNPNLDKVDNSILFSRWQHVFPKPSEMRVMKWKSLSCPAAVPLTTETFPTQIQFNTEYQRQPYNVAQDIDDDLSEEPKSRADFLRELVSARFAHGFQAIIGPSVAKAFDQKNVRVADVFSIDDTLGDGSSIFMSVGNTIHQLSCVNGTEVEVNIYVRKPTESLGGPQDSSYLYKPAVRTYLDETYHNVDIDIMTPQLERNWNYIDSYLAGYTDELTENLRFWRTRFVLIPMSSRTSEVPKGQDDEEEVRLEGIKRLLQTWQRQRYLPPSERQFQSAGAKKKDHNPLDIVYKTEDASVVIAAELETLPLFEGMENTHRKGLVSDRERFSKSNFNVAALAEAIQQPIEAGGIRMQSRRWHFRLHYHCFIGSDMTTWLLDNFDGLDSREEAVELGNSLMVYEDDKLKDKDALKDSKSRDRGIFVHVEKRHNFRDGQYFYQIAPEFAKLHPPGWFNRKKPDASVPSTPMSESIVKGSPRPGHFNMPRPTSTHEDNSPISGSTTPTVAASITATGKRPQVMLSKMMKYDVDPRRKSYRPERINLHYDRLHNPDNCYHIRIEWMNVTAKLIEDAIKNWEAMAAQHGLRFVELPLAEACRITEVNAFRRPYRIRLAVPPPAQQPVIYYDPNSLAPRAHPGRHFYLKALLRRFDYVLDFEAAANFPANVDVGYSWGRPDFKYSQFIHRSGIALAEITDDGDILCLANRLYTNRTVAAQQPVQVRNEAAAQAAAQAQAQAGAAVPNERVSRLMAGNAYSSYGLAEPTPISSPLPRPALFAAASSSARGGVGGTGGPPPHDRSPSGSGHVRGTSGLAGARPTPTTPRGLGLVPEPEPLVGALEAFCSDAAALEAFYRETLEKGMGTPTMAGGAAAAAAATAATDSSVPDAGIPTLGLPPGILGGGGTGGGGLGGGGGGPGGDMAAAAAAAASSSSPSPRVGTPGSLASSLFFRRGSVQH